jgi:hypothetical protein
MMKRCWKEKRVKDTVTDPQIDSIGGMSNEVRRDFLHFLYGALDNALIDPCRYGVKWPAAASPHPDGEALP